MKQGGDRDSDSILAVGTRLIDDVERFVRAEINLYRAQMMVRVGQAKSGIILLGIALVMAQATLVTLLLGLIYVLNEWIGIYWASGIVIVGSLIITGLLAKGGLSHLQTATDAAEDLE